MKCNRDTFILMYETVYKDMYRFALSLTKDSHDAKDCVSEAVLKAYEKREQLQEKKAFKGWIFTILANVCKKHFREKAKYLPITYLDEKRNYDYDLPLDVRRALENLNEEEQLIVSLSVFAGYNSSEIGTYLKVNPSTIRSKRSRALQKLAPYLAEEKE
ncbi:MAG TPA: RNA polymerase sigma factor [Candidatus Dorea intestinavium]|nr:RNA polymerase sigma factor [Candidatus Dorea intestinavium]